MIYELFKLKHCECVCVFNCTITLMAVNLFGNCDDSSCHCDEFILETWSISNDLDDGEVFVRREIKFRKGLGLLLVSSSQQLHYNNIGFGHF